MDIENLWYHLYIVSHNGAIQQHALGQQAFRALRRNGWLYQRTAGWYELSALGEQALGAYRVRRQQAG